MFPLCQTPFQFAIRDATQWLSVGGRQQMPAVITVQTKWKQLSFPIHWSVKISDFQRLLGKMFCSSKKFFLTAASNERIFREITIADSRALHIFINTSICIQQWSALSASYQAYGPSCSYSYPPGIAFHSRSGRLWCCKCWKSQSPSVWICSRPMVEAGTSAEREVQTL